MKALILSALIGLDVDCNLVATPFKSVESWQYQICVQRFSDYKNVKLKAIRDIRKKMPSSSKERKLEVSVPLGGRVVVTRVESLGDEGVVQITTHYTLDAYVDGWIASNHIRSNNVIKEHEVRKREVNIGKYIGLRDILVASPKGMYVQKNINKGQIIFGDYLSAKPLINRNSEVTVFLSSNNIQLEMKGIALEAGFIEDAPIKVRLMDTGKIFTGKVIDNEKVLIEM